MWYAAELGLYSYNNVLDVLRLRAKMKPEVQYMVESKFVGFRTRPPSVAIVINGYGGNFSDAIATNKKEAGALLVFVCKSYGKCRYMSLEVEECKEVILK